MLFAAGRHKLVEFPEQVLLGFGQVDGSLHLDPDEQVAITARFGEVLRVPFVRPLPDHPDVIGVLKEADERNISVFGGTWHSDFSFLDEPPSHTLLHAIELPDVGGDTVWSSQYAA